MRWTKGIGLSMLAPAMLLAESKNVADYPLRLHIFNRNQMTFYHRRVMDEAKGDGRADLYEGGMAHGVDFSFDCSDKIQASIGYETYPARWKKPGKELVVLMPEFGKTGSYTTCKFQTDVKGFAYAKGDGSLREETVEQFKDWMVRHDYDPEHGKDAPVKLVGAQGQTASDDSAPPASPPAAPPQQ